MFSLGFLPETLLLDSGLLAKAILLPAMILISLLKGPHHLHNLMQHGGFISVGHLGSLPGISHLVCWFCCFCVGVLKGSVLLTHGGRQMFCPTDLGWELVVDASLVCLCCHYDFETS